MTVEPLRAVGALERHAGDVDRLGLDVEIDDEVLGALARHVGIVEWVAGGVGQARVLQLGGVGDERRIRRPASRAGRSG